MLAKEPFVARVVELALEGIIPACKARGTDDFDKLAFACDYNPQVADSTLRTVQLLDPLVDGNTEKDPSLRMLWWESRGIAKADMRPAAEDAPDAPRKLGAPELNARRGEVPGKLPGSTIAQ